MSDLLLHAVPRKPQKGTKAPAAAPKQNQGQKSLYQTHAATRPLSRVVRGVNNYVLSWRDGGSEHDREIRRRVEERRQILAARMQNVYAPRVPRPPTKLARC